MRDFYTFTLILFSILSFDQIVVIEKLYPNRIGISNSKNKTNNLQIEIISMCMYFFLSEDQVNSSVIYYYA